MEIFIGYFYLPDASIVPTVEVEEITANGSYWPIPLKNSKKMEDYFSAESQNIWNSAQQLACKLTYSSVG